MPTEVKLPPMGQTMEEGTIVSCSVKPSDMVKKGDIIFEIETDKATLEMECPAQGYVKHIIAEINQTLPVGAVLMLLGEKDEEISQELIDSLKTKPASAPAITAPSPTVTSAKTQPKTPAAGAPIKVSPRAKKLAEELGVDLTTITGTGPAGRITDQDVKKAAESAPADAEPVDISKVKLGDTIPLTKLQRITAQRMLKSKQEIPCFYLNIKADVTDLVELRTKTNQSSDVKVSYNDFIIKAVAMGLEKFPVMTGQLDGNRIRLQNTINIGVAVAVPQGLIVPVVKDVQKKGVKTIAKDTNKLIEKANTNKLLLTDLEGGCITVSNLGGFGIDSFIPIVVPGQCSILGIGKITDTCVPDFTTPHKPDITVRKLMNMTLSVDHKVANGAYAAQFLDFIKQTLQDTGNFN